MAVSTDSSSEAASCYVGMTVATASSALGPFSWFNVCECCHYEKKMLGKKIRTLLPGSPEQWSRSQSNEMNFGRDGCHSPGSWIISLCDITKGLCWEKLLFKSSKGLWFLGGFLFVAKWILVENSGGTRKDLSRFLSSATCPEGGAASAASQP